MEMLALNFASTNFVYMRLAQDLSRSVPAFSCFMREYLDPVVKVDQCAQNVVDTGITANNTTDLTLNIRAVFQCIRFPGSKLINQNRHFGVRQVEFLGRTMSFEGVSPRTHTIQNLRKKKRNRKSKKAFQRYLGFMSYYRIYVSRMTEKLNTYR